MIVKLEENK